MKPRLHNTYWVALLLPFVAVCARAGTLAGSPTGLARDLLKNRDGEVRERFGDHQLVTTKQDYGIHYVFTLDGENPTGANLVEVLLTARDDVKPALARTPSFNVDFRGPMTGGMPSPELRPLFEQMVAAIRVNDTGDIVIPPPPPQELSPSGEVPRIHRQMAWIGLALVVLFLLLLPVTGRWVWDDLSGALGTRPWLTALCAAFAAGLALRLVAPHMPVMYYMGYKLAQDAGALSYIPKYGSGALALYHIVFQVTGTSHLVMSWVNSVFGALVPIAGAALLARMGASRVSVLSAAAMLAMAPVFVKDATTESILVPTMLWTLLGLHQFLRYRGSRSVTVMAVGWVHLLLAMYSRPEAVVLPAVCLVLLFWFAPKHEGGKRKSWVWLVVSLVVAHGLIILRAHHLSSAMEVEFARGNTPVLQDLHGLIALIPEFFTRDLVFRPALFPVGFLLLAGVGVLVRSTRMRTLALLACASVWLGVALVDLPYVSIPRVQVPGAIFMTAAAGLGAGALWELLSRLTGRALLMRGMAVLSGAAVAGSMAATIPALWAPVNADHEEVLLREAREVMPAERSILVRRGYDDQPEERLHLYYPDYWFTGGAVRDDIVVGPDRFVKMKTGGRPAFFLLGTRCYMRKCGESGMHPACRRILDRYRLEPVIERTVPVMHAPLVRRTRPDQDLDFPWCLSETGEMKIGLYRILGPKP